ncbi:hypothetical protein [Mucilaginibacter sp.]|jgi:hypothetical protein|uniref:hypothetical protein n=1 Tax=Mucilaginibacter sp. TaxID=1882438 RepID=UPI003569447C
MKLFKLQALILILLALSNTGYGYAQDNNKKAKSIAKAVVYNPYTKKYYFKKASATVTPAPVVATTPPATTPVQQKPADTTHAAPVDKSLRGQYKYLLTKIYNYQQPLVTALFKNYSDTLNANRRQLKEARATLSVQAKTIDTLKAAATTKDQILTESKAKVDEITLLGIPFTKATYNLIMWGLVIGFGAIAAIVIARSGSHSREAKYRIKLYEELEEEYKTYKTKANEKEKKLARELQTERNKLDELLGNG